jgi:gentisate 1,2-dioxygenase
MLRYPWKETREALTELASATDRDGLVQLAYINPVTGQECLPILGFSALMLRRERTLIWVGEPARR